MLALFAVFGFFLIPYGAKHYLEEHVQQQLDHELTLKKVRFNPFTLAVEVEKFNIARRQDHSSLVGFEIFSADFALLSSIYNGAWTFSDMKITEPSVYFAMTEKGGSNFSPLLEKLKGKQGEGTVENESNGLPGFLFERVSLIGGEIDFFDRRKTPPANVHMRALIIELNELTTLPERTGGYMVSAHKKAGGTVKWRGSVSVNPARSEGSFTLESIQVATAWEFLKESIRCEKPPGEFTLTGEYLFDLADH